MFLLLKFGFTLSGHGNRDILVLVTDGGYQKDFQDSATFLARARRLMEGMKTWVVILLLETDSFEGLQNIKADLQELTCGLDPKSVKASFNACTWPSRTASLCALAIKIC